MIRTLALLRDRRKALRFRDQQGFALLAMIAVIALTSVIVLGLLGLSYSSTLFSGQQVLRDRKTRAADSALDTAVEVLAREASTVGGVTSTEPCVLAERKPVGDSELPVMSIDGNDVVVTCTPQAPESPPAPLLASNESVKVVGSGYKGAVRASDTVPCAPGGTCLPWTVALNSFAPGAAGRAADYAARGLTGVSGASIVHSGPGPLTFSSDVTALTGAAAIRNPPCAEAVAVPASLCGEDQYGPALAVSGLYRQGDQGLSNTNQPNTRACGAQSRWNTPETKSVQIATLRIDPECNSTVAKAVSPSASGLERPFVWSQADLTTSLQLPASCPGSRVVQIQPGYYDSTQTAKLNNWFRTSSGGGSCDNKVFLFRSGDYYFDVNDSAPPRTGTVAAPNSLTFDDPTSVVVFGDPDQWSPATSPSVADVAAFFPDNVPPIANEPPQSPCALNDEGAPNLKTGVTLTLSSRTTLRHQRGRVAICDQRTSATPVTAIWQTPVRTPVFGPVDPSTAYASGGTFFSDLVPGVLNLGDGQSAKAVADCGPSSLFQSIISLILSLFGNTPGFCAPINASFTVPAWRSAFPTVPSPIDSLVLDLTGSSNKVNFGGARLVVSVTGPNLAAGTGSQRTCTAFENSSPGMNRTIDLLNPATGNCTEYIRELKNLAGAQFKIQYLNVTPACTLRFIFYVFNPAFCFPDYPSISLDGVKLTGKLLQDQGAATKPFLVTSSIESRPSSVYGDSFNLFGRLSAPLADVDIRWDGTPTPEPIFGGTMVVNGIGSSASGARVGTAYTAKPGLVCCVIAEPSERTVSLNAWVDVVPKPWPTPKDVSPKLNASNAQVTSGGYPVYEDRTGTSIICPVNGSPSQSRCSELDSVVFSNVFRYLDGTRKLVDPSGSRVLLESTNPDRVLWGRLAATARVSMLDFRVLPNGQAKVTPGYNSRVESWQLCASRVATFSGLTPSPTAKVDCFSP